MSSDLTWQIIRNNSCFLKTRRNVNKKFSTEKFNLMGLNSQRHSGLVNKKAVDVQMSEDGKNIVLSTKNVKKTNQPLNNVQSVVLKKNHRAALKTIKKTAKSYQGRYAMPAQRRASQLLRSLKPRAAKKTVKAE